MAKRPISAILLAIAVSTLAIVVIGAILSRSAVHPIGQGAPNVDYRPKVDAERTKTESAVELERLRTLRQNDSVSPADDPGVTDAESEVRPVVPNSEVSGQLRSADQRSLQLVHMYEEDAKEFFGRIETYISAQDLNGDWADTAEREITKWISDGVPDDSATRHVQCISDVCYVDLFVPAERFNKSYRNWLQDWRSGRPADFLPSLFFVKAGDDFYRVYVFRESFDPRSL